MFGRRRARYVRCFLTFFSLSRCSRQGPGDFRIVGVPAGRYQVTVWHEVLGTLQREVTVPTQGVTSMTLEFP